jgi:hypothetical protein|tara:strand:+ start:357 stop:458 length:102 start_codon:yes stop_codon:yes gene_type:complete
MTTAIQIKLGKETSLKLVKIFVDTDASSDEAGA